MMTIFKHQLARFRGQILGWGLGLGLYGWFIVQFYDTILSQKENIEKMLESYPKDVMAFFGDFDAGVFFTPAGYLDMYFFSYMLLVPGIFAVIVGSGLLASDEEDGRLDLLLAYPVRRVTFLLGRLLAFFLALASILLVTWLGFAIPSGWTSLGLSWFDLLLPFLSLYGVLVFFGALATLFSLLLPSRRLAATATGFALVGNYFLLSLGRINADLKPITKLTPLYYSQGGQAVEGLNLTWFLGFVLGALLFAVLSGWRFQRRDIRVGGEGGWRRPKLSQLRPRRLLARLKS